MIQISLISFSYFLCIGVLQFCKVLTSSHLALLPLILITQMLVINVNWLLN